MTDLVYPDTQPEPITIGEYTIVPLVEAVGAAMPARAAYPSVPAEQLRALLDACGDAYTNDERTHLRMASQAFAICGGGHVILVDACLGGPKPHRPQPRPGFVSRWPAALAAAGLRADHVDTVITTHLHHDHVGWNTTFHDGRLKPTFPEARYLVTHADLDHFTTGTPQTHITDSVLPLRATGQLHTIEPTTVIAGGIRLVPAPGHTPGHVLVEVASGDRRALLAADLVHHPLQLRHPDISIAMCVDPRASATSRAAILHEYADSGTLFLPSHFPQGGYLRRAGDACDLSATP